MSNPGTSLTPTPTPTPTPTQTLGNGDRPGSEREQFANFFESFLAKQSEHLSALHAAASVPASAPADDSSLSRLVSDVVSHYEHYYDTKAAAAQKDVNSMFSPSWTSTTENIFMWAGGWRPSAAFHLLQSKSGIQLEARLAEIIRGGVVKDLGNMSATQLEALDRLQRETIRAERVISEEAAEAQEAVAAAEMVQLVGSEDRAEMDLKMAEKKEAMRIVLARADQLRIETIKGIVDILVPIQAVHFLIAAAELHLAVHEYGKGRDELVAEGVA